MVRSAFADADYYNENFGSPPARIAARLDQELARASRYVRAEYPGIDARIELFLNDPDAAGALDPDLVADVVCEMVTTAAASPAGPGIASTQTGAGPYQETLNYTNPVGDLYFSKKQRKILGYGRQAAFTVPMVSDAEFTPPWGAS